MGANNSSQLSALDKALMALESANSLATAMATSRLPQEVVQTIHKIFLDSCPNQEMDRHQFRTFYQNFFSGGKSGCFEFFDHLYRAYDLDGSGYLDFFEFLQIAEILYCGSTEEKLDLSFRVCDVDGNGTVEEEELQDIFGAMLQMSEKAEAERLRLPPVMARSIFKRLDTDGDGHLTKKEFIEGCANETLFYDIFKAVFALENKGT